MEARNYHILEIAESFLEPRADWGVVEVRQSEIARRLGSEPPPESVAELKHCINRFRPECRGGSQARETLRFLLFPPLPFLLRGPYGVLTAAAITSLPGWARRELWLPVLPLTDPLAVRPAASVLTRAIGWLMAADPREFELADRRLVD